MADRNAQWPGVLDPQGIATLSGFDIIDGIARGALPGASIAERMGFWISDVQKGRVTFEGIPDERVLNPVGTVHGGWYGAILDSAMACSVHTVLDAGAAYTTLEYKINIVRPIPVGTRVKAVGTVSHAGRSTAVAQARLEGSTDGRLYATGSTTCIVLARSKDGQKDG